MSFVQLQVYELTFLRQWQSRDPKSPETVRCEFGLTRVLLSPAWVCWGQILHSRCGPVALPAKHFVAPLLRPVLFKFKRTVAVSGFGLVW
jgi:hypothetical protein